MKQKNQMQPGLIFEEVKKEIGLIQAIKNFDDKTPTTIINALNLQECLDVLRRISKDENNHLRNMVADRALKLAETFEDCLEIGGDIIHNTPDLLQTDGVGKKFYPITWKKIKKAITMAKTSQNFFLIYQLLPQSHPAKKRMLIKSAKLASSFHACVNIASCLPFNHPIRSRMVKKIKEEKLYLNSKGMGGMGLLSTLSLIDFYLILSADDPLIVKIARQIKRRAKTLERCLVIYGYLDNNENHLKRDIRERIKSLAKTMGECLSIYKDQDIHETWIEDLIFERAKNISEYIMICQSIDNHDVLKRAERIILATANFDECLEARFMTRPETRYKLLKRAAKLASSLNDLLKVYTIAHSYKVDEITSKIKEMIKKSVKTTDDCLSVYYKICDSDLIEKAITLTKTKEEQISVLNFIIRNQELQHLIKNLLA